MAGKRKVLVGMSGGVDSSVAAALLVKQGYDVTGGFIKNWSDTKDLWTGECSWRGERRDALRVAAKLGIPLLTFDFEKEYRERVLAIMFDQYRAGLTPNPDVLCNQEIKFGLFFKEAMRRGFDFIATGHYVQKRGFRRPYIFSAGDAQAHLLKSRDSDKDQSYFLCRISQEALRHTLFPIGGMTKARVRDLAKRFGLSTAKKPDSQGICFVGKMNMHEFLRKKIPSSPGEIVTKEGTVVGHHDGVDAYTIGQRQGLGVSRDQKTWYVAVKDQERRRLIVVPDREDPLLYRREAVIRDMHWIASESKIPERGLSVEVAVRYRQKPVKAILKGQETRLRQDFGGQARDKKQGGDGTLSSVSCYSLLFRHPIWALTPGQSAVMYRGKECLGGGYIDVLFPDPRLC